MITTHRSFIVQSDEVGTPLIDTEITNGLRIPAGAINIQMRVISASVWNTAPNIFAGKNTFTVYPAELGTYGTTPYLITIPQGQYSVDTLDTAISRQLLDYGLAIDLVQVEGDSATQKVYFVTSADFTKLEFDSKSPIELLGITLQGGTREFLLESSENGYAAQERARFNSVNSFRISNNLAGQGLEIQGAFNGTVCDMPIVSRPGEINIFQPAVPTTVSIDHSIAGSTLYSMTSGLRSDKGDLLYGLQEPWSYTFELTWDVRERELEKRTI